MRCYGLTLNLRHDPEMIAAYKEHHQKVWSGVTARIREVGITEMKIFLVGQRLFMYLEAEDRFDPATDFARINENPVSQEWDVLMRTLQERAPEAREGEWWARMDQVFDLNWPQHR